MTAYFMYLDEQRPAIVKKLGEQAKTRGMVAKTAAEQWRGLSADEKAPYEKKAAAAKTEYDNALQTFKASGGEIVRKQRKAGKDKKPKKDKEAPKKPSGGGYGQYLAEHRAEIVKSLPAGSNQTTDVTKAAGTRWKALSEDDKKPYEEKYAAKMKEYQAAMEAYKASKGGEDEKEDEEEQAEKPAKRARKEEKPAKIAKTAKAAPKATAGKGRGRGRGAAKSKGPEAPEIDASVLAEAAKLGFEAQLQNLAGRQDVKDLGKSDKDLLSAIKDSNGLVNPARRALLGA